MGKEEPASTNDLKSAYYGVRHLDTGNVSTDPFPQELNHC